MYRRGKKEDVIKFSKKEMTVYIGSVDDSFESLQTMCNDASIELLKTIELDIEEEMEVVFITGDFPELIGISSIRKDKNGTLSFTLNFEQSTL